MALILVHEATGKSIKPGDTVVTFRGQEVTLDSFNEGRVYCRDGKTGQTYEWFPSVIGCDVREPPTALFRTAIGVSIRAGSENEAREIAAMLARILTAADPRCTWAEADEPEVIPADYNGAY